MQPGNSDYLVILLFFLAMIMIGLWSWVRNRTLEDYFVAGGKIPWWFLTIPEAISEF